MQHAALRFRSFFFLLVQFDKKSLTYLISPPDQQSYLPTFQVMPGSEKFPLFRISRFFVNGGRAYLLESFYSRKVFLQLESHFLSRARKTAWEEQVGTRKNDMIAIRHFVAAKSFQFRVKCLAQPVSTLTMRVKKIFFAILLSCCCCEKNRRKSFRPNFFHFRLYVRSIQIHFKIFQFR
jgi:hypothetical protein